MKVTTTAVVFIDDLRLAPTGSDPTQIRYCSPGSSFYPATSKIDSMSACSKMHFSDYNTTGQIFADTTVREHAKWHAAVVEPANRGLEELNSMQFVRTAIPDVIEILPKVFGDARGFFMETYREDLFREAGIPTNFVQDNHSASEQGVLRGLHYQIAQPQGKLVRVIVGEVYDVAVDLRRSSPTFGQWVSVRLSSETKNQVWIPAGFAHGFYVLSARAEVQYKASDYYAPQCERTLLWNDPALNIQWPLLQGQAPILSAKDAAGKLLAEAELYR